MPGGWDTALADGMQDANREHVVVDARKVKGSPVLQTHHQPFNYYARFAPGTTDLAVQRIASSNAIFH